MIYSGIPLLSFHPNLLLLLGHNRFGSMEYGLAVQPTQTSLVARREKAILVIDQNMSRRTLSKSTMAKRDSTIEDE